MLEKVIHVWCLQRDQFGHTQPVEAAMQDGAQFTYDETWDAARMLQAAPDLVLCVNDFPYEIARCLEAAREQNIPSLVLQDGILEWRCQFENPLFGAGGGAPQHQPVIADKIACIGFQSARQIAAWGGAAKVEVTGMPRMDALTSAYDPAAASHTGAAKRRVLVMTAKKPGFTPEQTAVTLKSLQDVQAYFANRPDIDVIWRVTKNLDFELGVDNQLRELDSLDLVSVVKQVDAVITTISTAILEVMLLRRPVAALDYHNVPRFVETAWTISAPEQIDSVVNELLEPSAAKMAYQQERLADTLYLQPAAPRVAALIERMAQAGREARTRGIPLALPPVVLPFDLYREQKIALHELYPAQAVYQETDAEKLKLRLARLEKDYAQLKDRAATRDIGYWVNAAGRFLARRLGAGRGR